MFDGSFPELVLVFIIGLMVLGPQRLPKVAAEIGKWVGRARRTAAELRRQLEREIELNDIQPPPPPSPTDTQNPFHHAPLDTGATPPPADTAPPAATAPPATAGAPAAPTAPTLETATANAPAKAPEPVSAPAPEATKAPEPTDRPPHA